MSENDKMVAQRRGFLKTLGLAGGAAVAAMLTPIQARYTELMNDKAELGRLLRIGAEKAGAVAQATLARAHNAIGFYPR